MLNKSHLDKPVPDLSGFVKLDQTTPQTITGLTDGVIELINGVIGTRVVSPAFTYFV